ncbi:MAG: 50S ribosomal protein L22 [Candidatus Altarchaeaceae archaeon]
MVEWKYCYNPKDLKRAARSYGVNVPCSYKHAVMVARALNGMKLEEAYMFLEEVMQKKRFVPFVKFNKSRGHKRKINGIGGPGGYPIKACKEFLKLLKNAERNAEKNVNLNVKNLRIKHICALKGRKIEKLKPKGRWAIWRKVYTHLQVVLEEDTEEHKITNSNV